MNLIGNIIWFLFGGMISGIHWIISGIIWCCTIIGIPYGLQCFKFASLSFAPFGKEIKSTPNIIPTIANIIWCIFFGIPMAIENIVIGLLWCCTIIGIPFGLQFFKIAHFSLAPFGKEIV